MKPNLAENKPNVLFVVIDALRADHVSSYGYGRQTTPVLDSLAQEGVRFEHAYTAGTWSLPSYASLFTGASVSKHGVGDDRTKIRHLSDPVWRTLPEFLRGQGYHTAGFSNNTFVSRDFHFHRGFDYFRETWKLVDEDDTAFLLLQRLGGHGFRSGKRRNLGHSLNRLYFDRIDRRWSRGEKGARKTNKMFANWLRYLWLDHRPFFAFVLYLEPHSLYWPPQPFRDMFFHGDQQRAMAISDKAKRAYDYLTGRVQLSNEEFRVLSELYDGQIRYVDYRLGELLHTLKQSKMLDNTLIIVTSDHGEHLGEHGWLAHASPSLYEPGVRVPLIIRYPSAYDAGQVISSPVSTLDIYATIADLVANERTCLSEQLQGFSLLPARFEDLRERAVVIESLDTHADAFARTAPDFDVGNYDYIQRALRWREYKYIQKSESGPELYDVVRDPGEQENLATRELRLIEDMQCRLDEWLASFEPCATSLSEDEWQIGEEVRQRLAALGYVEF